MTVTYNSVFFHLLSANVSGDSINNFDSFGEIKQVFVLDKQRCLLSIHGYRLEKIDCIFTIGHSWRIIRIYWNIIRFISIMERRLKRSYHQTALLCWYNLARTWIDWLSVPRTNQGEMKLFQETNPKSPKSIIQAKLQWKYLADFINMS